MRTKGKFRGVSVLLLVSMLYGCGIRDFYADTSDLSSPSEGYEYQENIDLETPEEGVIDDLSEEPSEDLNEVESIIPTESAVDDGDSVDLDPTGSFEVENEEGAIGLGTVTGDEEYIDDFNIVDLDEITGNGEYNDDPVDADDIIQIGGGEDNWSLSVHFYEENNDFGAPVYSTLYDFSDGGTLKTEDHILRVVITYSNNSVSKGYKPGELSIKVDRLLFDDEVFDCSNVVYSANTAGITGYDWECTSYSTRYFTFRNVVEIEEGSNFEGTIEMVYTLSMRQEHSYSPSGSSWSVCELAGECADECEHSGSFSFKAVLNDTIESNTIDFSYYRLYSHPWIPQEYTISKTLFNVSEGDMESVLINSDINPDDYYWVGFYLKLKWEKTDREFILSTTTYFKDLFPENALLWVQQPNDILRSVDGSLVYIEEDFAANIVAAYHKSDYPDGNLTITNTAELWGYYTRRETINDIRYLSEGTVSFSLADFEFIYNGNIYRVDKKGSTDRGFTKLSILNDTQTSSNTNQVHFYINPTARFNGAVRDLKICDDILMSLYDDGTIHQLSDSEYYMSRITWDNNALLTEYNQLVPEDIAVDLYVRRAGNVEYELLKSFEGHERLNVGFTKADAIVSFYFYLHGLKSSLNPRASGFSTANLVTVYLNYIDPNVTSTGTLYNFCYYEAYQESLDGSKYIANIPGEDSYSSLYSKEYIMSYDLENYGHLLQRGTANSSWVDPPIELSQVNAELSKKISSTYNVQTDQYTGTCNLKINFSNIIPSGAEKHYLNYVEGLEFYDVLPEGMSLESSPADIINSFSGYSYFSSYDLYFQDTMEKVLESTFKENCHVSVSTQGDYRGTGRVFLKVVISFDRPLYVSVNNYKAPWAVSVTYKFSATGQIPSYTNWVNAYVKSPSWYGETKEDSNVNYGGFSDINDNGVVEPMLYAKDSFSSTAASGSFQGVLTYVKADNVSFYSTKTTKVEAGGGYSYKLRAMAGGNKITNLVLYTSLESLAKNENNELVPADGGNPSWKGMLVGVDTSYATSQGYNIKVYCSPNEAVSNLAEDTSWVELTDSTDLKKVKSLAFEYLDANGNKAVLPNNTDTYVEIKMLSPNEEMKGYAYEGYWSEWNALTEAGGIIDFISGIRSNIVKVTNSSLFDLSVYKVWEDEDNRYDVRPNSVDIGLYKAGELVDTKTISAPDWFVVFEDLDGSFLDYSVAEVGGTGVYKALIYHGETENSFKIVNKIDWDKNTNWYIQKSWYGDTAAIRPDSIIVDIYKNDVYYKSFEITKEDSYSSGGSIELDPGCFVKDEYIPADSYEWSIHTILPNKDENGNDITYSIKEHETPEGYTTHEVEEYWNTLRLVNNHEQDYRSFYVNKDWVLDSILLRPDRSEVTFNLYMEDELVEVFTLSSSGGANSWYGYTKGAYPKYDKEGNEISYRIEENTPEGYRSSITKDEYGRTFVKNTYLYTSVQGRKVWNGVGNIPDSITVWLLRNGERFLSQKVSAEDNWSYAFTDLIQVDEEGNLYEWSIEEEPVNGWTPSYGGVHNAISFAPTNKTWGTFQLFINVDDVWYVIETTKSAVSIPVKDFYVYWYDNGENSPDITGCYLEDLSPIQNGWSVASDEDLTFLQNLIKNSEEIVGGVLPDPEEIYVGAGTYITLDAMYHYTAVLDEDLSPVPKAGVFDIVNTPSEEEYLGPEMPNTGSNDRLMLFVFGMLGIFASVIIIRAVPKKRKLK